MAAVSLSDQIDRAITRLAALQVRAANLRRTHPQTFQLLVDIEAVAKSLGETARGERDRAC